ncbi:hypothetical protein G7B40_000275 [Aetokthonos hydrillicola Thurmond2011]|jgi:hypothetical protein|uniref:Uncharacterized protein n=1 Tax=Aetokthonos hydrillicola Thurmond2011 TaxID=2712845 RepID=A0AAP5I1D1_9CYAN|nr:hypothetical protein [Aetokthonos hydrillicola]MBO3460164.1 hypothetical protein [Aetokthonos hydrillicola CCALA 1050]MBW4590570.1 hypothetical protein [Aetokthonos hydrillicola CCALA 1050]MDR9893021.1 hypothetical protein [Aetokthonos hydrillicola Thurmond2011]
MANCPVCNTEYTEGDVGNCSICGWDLSPYPIVFAGQIHDAFLEKERKKLAWAKQSWLKSQSKEELDRANQEISLLLSELDLTQQEKYLFEEEVEQLTKGQKQIQNQLQHLQQKKKELEVELAEQPSLKEVNDKFQQQIRLLEEERKKEVSQVTYSLDRANQRIKELQIKNLKYEENIFNLMTLSNNFIEFKFGIQIILFICLIGTPMASVLMFFSLSNEYCIIILLRYIALIIILLFTGGTIILSITLYVAQTLGKFGYNNQLLRRFYHE